MTHPPNLVAGDRGVHSAETEEQLKAAGVKRVAILPVSSATMAGARAGITGKMGWSGGWAWACWPAICAISPSPVRTNIINGKAHPSIYSITACLLSTTFSSPFIHFAMETSTNSVYQ